MMMRNQKGAGLIDSLIAFLILGVGVLALVKFQNSLVYNDDLSQQRSDALILAIKQIETLRDYSTITQYNAITNGSSTVAGVNTTYTITWTVTPNTTPTYKTINVVVSWADRFGGSQSVQQVSRIASLDPTSSASIM